MVHRKKIHLWKTTRAARFRYQQTDASPDLQNKPTNASEKEQNGEQQRLGSGKGMGKMSRTSTSLKSGKSHHAGGPCRGNARREDEIGEEQADARAEEELRGADGAWRSKCEW